MLHVSCRRAVVAVQVLILVVQIADDLVGRGALAAFVVVIRVAILVISNVTVVVVDGLLRRIEISLVVRVAVLGRVGVVMVVLIVVFRFVQIRFLI